jgi:hypothetical protein
MVSNGPERRFDWVMAGLVIAAMGATGAISSLVNSRELQRTRIEFFDEVHGARVDSDLRTSTNSDKISALQGEVLALEAAIQRLSLRVSDAFAARDLALRVGFLEGSLGVRATGPTLLPPPGTPATPAPPSAPSTPAE